MNGIRLVTNFNLSTRPIKFRPELRNARTDVYREYRSEQSVKLNAGNVNGNLIVTSTLNFGTRSNDKILSNCRVSEFLPIPYYHFD